MNDPVRISSVYRLEKGTSDRKSFHTHSLALSEQYSFIAPHLPTCMLDFPPPHDSSMAVIMFFMMAEFSSFRCSILMSNGALSCLVAASRFNQSSDGSPVQSRNLV